MAGKSYKGKAQSTMEYAMVFACVCAALLGMGIYIKRGFQGRLKDAANEIGDQYSANCTKSLMTQTIVNPSPVNVTTTPRWISITDASGATHTYEISEVTRNETQIVTTAPGSYEETGNLADELN